MSGQNNIASHKVNVEIPEVALLTLVSSDLSQVKIEVSAPDKAGSSVVFTGSRQNNFAWLHYSSVIRSQNHRRKISAAIQGDIPEGFRIIVEASEASGGKGNLGKPSGKTILSQLPKEIISGIGSCFTGKGVHNGHHLSYQLENLDSPDNSMAYSTGRITVNVLYTLADHD
jgi:hypothetical protein